MRKADDSAGFAQIMMPHLDAAYNLARWLTRDPQDAADVVQDAMLRGLRFFGTYRGTNAKAWLLTIVRNTAYSWMKANRRHETDIGDGASFEDFVSDVASPAEDPEETLIRTEVRHNLDQLIESLPAEFRECLVLREIEDLSYKEIAQVTGVPIGTVMSRLARARRLLQRGWVEAEA